MQATACNVNKKAIYFPRPLDLKVWELGECHRSFSACLLTHVDTVNFVDFYMFQCLSFRPPTHRFACIQGSVLTDWAKLALKFYHCDRGFSGVLELEDCVDLASRAGPTPVKLGATQISACQNKSPPTTTTKIQLKS